MVTGMHRYSTSWWTHYFPLVGEREERIAPVVDSSLQQLLWFGPGAWLQGEASVFGGCAGACHADIVGFTKNVQLGTTGEQPALGCTSLWLWKFLSWYPHCFVRPQKFRQGPYFRVSREISPCLFKDMRSKLRSCEIKGVQSPVCTVQLQAFSPVAVSWESPLEHFQHLFISSWRLCTWLAHGPIDFRDPQSAQSLLQNPCGCGSENSLLWALSPASLNFPDAAFENFPLNSLSHSTEALKEKSETGLFLVRSWLWRDHEWENWLLGNYIFSSCHWVLTTLTPSIPSPPCHFLKLHSTVIWNKFPNYQSY